MRYLFTLLALLLGAYMIIDGVMALFTGNYISPTGGPYAGQLGPWATLLRAAGIDPQATPVRLAFVALGIAWFVHATFVIRDRRNAVATSILAILTLWYVPFGTIVALLELAAVVFRVRERRT